MIIEKEIEARVDELMANLPYLNKTEGGVEGFKVRLRRALVEVSGKPNITALERAVIDAAAAYRKLWLKFTATGDDFEKLSPVRDVMFAAVDALAAKSL